MVPPRPPELPDCVNCIMYYTSVADSGGATTGVAHTETGQPFKIRSYSVVDDWPVRLGFSSIVVSEIDAPNVFVSLL